MLVGIESVGELKVSVGKSVGADSAITSGGMESSGATRAMVSVGATNGGNSEGATRAEVPSDEGTLTRSAGGVDEVGFFFLFVIGDS